MLIDALVVGRDGTPVEGLKPADFEVFLDGKRRPVVSADFLRAASTQTARPETATASGATQPSAERIILLGIDEASFPVTAQAAAREAAARVIKQAGSEDYVGLLVYPAGIEIAPTRERRPLQEALSRISGARVDVKSSRFNISASEAARVKAREPVATSEILCRECGCPAGRDPNCNQELKDDASNIAIGLEQQGMMTLDAFHRILDKAAALPGRKTLIMVTAGLPMSNRVSGQPDFNAETARVARRAAAANVNLYVFYMNVHFIQAFSPAYGKLNHSIYDDIAMFGYGLEKFADGAGGAFFQIEVDSDPFVDRALRETSAGYVLAIDVELRDRDGKEHFIRVGMKQKSTTVRYRRSVTIPRG